MDLPFLPGFEGVETIMDSPTGASHQGGHPATITRTRASPFATSLNGGDGTRFAALRRSLPAAMVPR